MLIQKCAVYLTRTQSYDLQMLMLGSDFRRVAERINWTGVKMPVGILLWKYCENRDLLINRDLRYNSSIS